MSIHTPTSGPENTVAAGSHNRRDFLKRLTAPFALALQRAVGGEKLGHPFTTDHEKERSELIERLWPLEQPIYDKIAHIGMQRFFDALPDKNQAFLSPKQIAEGAGVCACCADEGIRKVPNQNGKLMLLLRTPGSGILHALHRSDKDPFAPEFLRQFAKEQADLGVTVFTAHAGCGAAKAVFQARVEYLQQQGKDSEAKKLQELGLDAWAKSWAKAVSENMLLVAKEHVIPHATNIRSDFIVKLDRPSALHPARCLYLTDDDAFNAAYSCLPQGFVERTGGANLDTILAHVDVLRSIAFDTHHGFGAKFSEKPGEQFLICAIAKSPYRLSALQARAKKALETLPVDIQKKIRIEGIFVE